MSQYIHKNNRNNFIQEKANYPLKNMRGAYVQQGRSANFVAHKRHYIEYLCLNVNNFLAFLWLIIVGSNIAQYYSVNVPYQGAIIFAGTLYFSLIYRTQLFRLLTNKEYLAVLIGLFMPVLLMFLSERSFARGIYTSQVIIMMTFVITSVFASSPQFGQILRLAAFTIVAVATALNLYELFITNNIWSIAPGRSAGFYINPNISGQALIGYGLVFISLRNRKITTVDFVLIVLVVLGVLSTFSRMAVLAFLVLLPPAVLLRTQPKHLLRIITGGIASTVLGYLFALYVMTNLDLSQDAIIRIDSLLANGGIGDYQELRGQIARSAINLAMRNPLTGLGVHTALEMPVGPHNMYIAMLVDYGIVGLSIYILMVVRIAIIAYSGPLHFSAFLWLMIGWLIVFSFASHNLLNDTATMPLIGFTLAHAYRIMSLKSQRGIIR